MSLDIYLYGPDSEEIASMNWLRNSFGLCTWAEDNVGEGKDRALWHVINDWSYAKSSEVDRPLFLKVVSEYSAAVMKLEQGYFLFDLPGYIQFVEPYKSHLPKERLFIGMEVIKGAKYVGHRMAIPMQHFGSAFHLTDPSFERYKRWMGELLEFANLLQDTGNTFYCSN